MNGHDTRDDRYVDTLGADLLHPLKKAIDIVKELGDNEVSTGIHFGFQVVKFSLFVPVVFRMSVRVG